MHLLNYIGAKCVKIEVLCRKNSSFKNFFQSLYKLIHPHCKNNITFFERFRQFLKIKFLQSEAFFLHYLTGTLSETLFRQSFGKTREKMNLTPISDEGCFNFII